jgi:tetratricopeptide (TPR) repeat protein
MKSVEIDLYSRLYRGEYKAVIATWQDSRLHDVRQTPAVVGALAYVGRIDEARDLFQDAELTAAEKVECRFYLGVGHARLSKYEEARNYFGSNLRTVHNAQSDREKFFIYQGMGFYRYFNGRFRRARHYAESAHKAARSAKFTYGEVLSEDLLGHCRVRTGEILQGLNNLKSALQDAHRLGDAGLTNAVAISLSIYQAKYRLNAKQAVRLLTKTLKSIETEDNYSKASLLIEFSEIYIHTGRIDLARKMLERAMESVYTTQNYRQEVMVNLQFARIYLLSGMATQALTALNLCRRTCNPLVDLPLLIEILALEANVHEQMAKLEKKAEVENEIGRLVKFSGDTTDLRFLKDKFGFLKRSQGKGQDLIGDLMNESLESTNVHDVLDSGYLGLLVHALKLNPYKINLCLDFVPGSLAVVAQGQVHYVPQGLSSILRKIILLLREHESATKSVMIENVWGYRYDPVMHDPVVFAALGRLRSLLGEFRHILVLSEEGYSLSDSVEVISQKPSARPKATPMAQIAAMATSQIDQLNIRQLQIINYLNEQQFIDIRICQKIFKTSPITASRDLSQLQKKGLVTRVGRARATKYILPRE